MKKCGRFTAKKLLSALDELSSVALFALWFLIGAYLFLRFWGFIG